MTNNNSIFTEFTNMYDLNTNDTKYKNAIYKDFAYNMTENILTDIDAVANTIRYLLLFPYGSRKYNRTLGIQLEYMIFDPFDEITKANIELDIKKIENFDERLKIETLNIDMDYNTYSYNIYLEFSVVGIGKGSVSESIKTIHS